MTKRSERRQRRHRDHHDRHEQQRTPGIPDQQQPTRRPVPGRKRSHQQRRSAGRDVERLAVVITEVDRAVTVLQDYLSFARPLSDLRLGSVLLRPLLEDAAGVLEARALEKGLTLSISAENVEAWADRQRLRDAQAQSCTLAWANPSPRGGTVELTAARVGDERHPLQAEARSARTSPWQRRQHGRQARSRPAHFEKESSSSNARC
jgi:hypothetical protein